MSKSLIFALFLSCFLFGCAPSIKIISEFSDPAYSIGQVAAQSKVRLYMAESVNVMEFKNSYEKEYNSDQQFVQIVQKQATDTMHSVLGCTMSSGNPQEAASLTGGSCYHNLDTVLMMWVPRLTNPTIGTGSYYAEQCLQEYDSVLSGSPPVGWN